MKLKKWIRRIVAVAACMAVLGVGASAFAADDSGESPGLEVTCTLRMHSRRLLKDSCTAITKTDSETIHVAAFAGIYNDAWGLMTDSEYVHGGGEASARLKSYNRNSAAYAVSAHTISGTDYGNFFYMQGATF